MRNGGYQGWKEDIYDIAIMNFKKSPGLSGGSFVTPFKDAKRLEMMEPIIDMASYSPRVSRKKGLS